MKTLLITGLMLLSATAFADKCKVSSTVSVNDSQCEFFSTKFDVDSVESCKQLAQSTRENKFFGILEGKERVLKTSYKYTRTAPTKLKVKETIEFEDSENICW